MIGPKPTIGVGKASLEEAVIARAVSVVAGLVVVLGVVAGLAVWYRLGGMFERIRRRKLAGFPFESNRGRVVMIGSSSFEYWKTAEQDLAPVGVLNLGIGGTAIAHWTGYLDSTVLPYRPRGLMIYAGLNDFNVRADPIAVFSRMKQLLDAIEVKLPGVPVLCLGLCPTLARATNWEDIEQFNSLVAKLCRSKPGFHFLDSTAEILDENAQLQKEIYRFDGLHFNALGYACWLRSVKPAVDRVFG